MISSGIGSDPFIPYNVCNLFPCIRSTKIVNCNINCLRVAFIVSTVACLLMACYLYHPSITGSSLGIRWTYSITAGCLGLTAVVTGIILNHRFHFIADENANVTSENVHQNKHDI